MKYLLLLLFAVCMSCEHHPDTIMNFRDATVLKKELKPYDDHYEYYVDLRVRIPSRYQRHIYKVVRVQIHQYEYENIKIGDIIR